MQNIQVVPKNTVTVYWRPGCPYCSKLRRELRLIGLVTSEVNIWANPLAAAIVRSFAGGNETVPTVVVGGQGLVNPSPLSVVNAVRALESDFNIDEGAYLCARRRHSFQVGKWITLSAGIVASFGADAIGHRGLSWTIDGISAVIYLGFRRAIRRANRNGQTII